MRILDAGLKCEERRTVMNLMGEKPVYKRKYDVVVVGGGIAGIAAAVSASREGASVLLIEKSINLGGLATNGLISWYEPLCDGKGNQIIRGIAEEMIQLAVKYGFDNLPPKWGGHCEKREQNQRYSTFYSPTVFSVVLEHYALEEGVHLRLDTLATYPVMERNYCCGIVVESVGGREFFESGAVVDATGDATVMHRAGVPTVDGKNFMTYLVHSCNSDTLEQTLEEKDFCNLRQWTNVGSDMYGNGHPEEMGMMTGVTAEEITAYVTEGKRRLFQALEKRTDKNNYDILMLPTMAQLRTIRRIKGDCDFEAIDRKSYEDSIGRCGDFRPDCIGKIYEIPAGALHNSKFPNLFAAGRIISVRNENAWEAARVIPVCALTGEAAGKLAVHSV